MTTEQSFEAMLRDARALASNTETDRETLAKLVLILCDGLEKLDALSALPLALLGAEASDGR